MAKKKGKRIWAIIGLIVVFGLVALWSWVGPVFMTFAKAGFFEPEIKHEYTATSKENLRRLQTALMLYHDSEGHFPEGSGWMDAIENRLQTNDLKAGEGAKKLIRPGVGPNEYGYALNSAVSGKYVDDLPSKAKTVLVYESKETMRNAVGQPGDEMGIRADGEMVNAGKTEPKTSAQIP